MQNSCNQDLFIEQAMAGKNIFLTGKAGTGKSYIVRQLISLLQKGNKKVIALAPTGIAANNIGGQTIHSMFALNPFGVTSFETTNFVKAEKRKLLDKVEVIIIDEVSMLRPDILDGMGWTLLKNGCQSLHKKQIIFIGDLKQLPPPIDDNTRSVLYMDYDGYEFYHSKMYEKLDVQTIELDEVHRQTNVEFIDNLNIVRDGGKSEYFKQFVSKEAKGIVLAPHNSTVKKYNTDGLNALHGDEFIFEANVSGNIKPEDFNLESEIIVKNGAKIMYLVNSKENNNLFNGTLGIFVSHKGCHYIRVGNVDYALDRVIVSKKEYVYDKNSDSLVLRELGQIEQYPIKLAYALSIHKSQGLTFDEVTVDLSRPCFQKGQMYVSLSRVKTPEGLRIIVS